LFFNSIVNCIFFFQDGLPLGIAYILKLLDQESDFDSLHFFDSAHNLYQTSIDKLKHEIAGMHKRRQVEVLFSNTETKSSNRLKKKKKKKIGNSSTYCDTESTGKIFA
jgi:hypothetical protein